MKYKEAIKRRIKFSTPLGLVKVDRLFELKKSDIIECLKESRKILKESESDDYLSFLDTTTPVNHDEELRFEILKDIYLDMCNEENREIEEREIKKHNEKIYRQLSKIDEMEFESKSRDELLALLK